MDRNIPYGICNFVYQEVLQGAKTEKDFSMLKEYLATLPFYYLNHEKESFEKAAYITFMCRKSGITIRNTIDVLIAQIAIENKLYLLHNDRDFDHMASVVKELKVLEQI
ncbi:MAG TPA: VapC toxin family PIN domain ribonuclease [Treponema sp.]|nr:VapC toxin family PIN domain ribonuclease [Treponema sp.]